MATLQIYPYISIESEDTYLSLEDTSKTISVVYHQDADTDIVITNNPLLTLESMDNDTVILNSDKELVPVKEGTTTIYASYESISAKKEFIVYDNFFKTNYTKHFLSSYDEMVIETNLKLKCILDTLMEYMDIIYVYQTDIPGIRNPIKTKHKYLQTLFTNFGFPKEDFIDASNSMALIADSMYRELLYRMLDILELRGTRTAYELFFGALGYDIELTEFWFNENDQLVAIDPIDQDDSSFYKYSIEGIVDEVSQDDPRRLVAVGNAKGENNKARYIQPIFTPKADSIESEITEDEYNNSFLAFNASRRKLIRKYLEFLKPMYVEYLSEVYSLTPLEEILEDLSDLDIDEEIVKSDLNAYNPYLFTENTTYIDTDLSCFATNDGLNRYGYKYNLISYIDLYEESYIKKLDISADRDENLYNCILTNIRPNSVKLFSENLLYSNVIDDWNGDWVDTRGPRAISYDYESEYDWANNIKTFTVQIGSGTVHTITLDITTPDETTVGLDTFYISNLIKLLNFKFEQAGINEEIRATSGNFYNEGLIIELYNSDETTFTLAEGTGALAVLSFNAQTFSKDTNFQNFIPSARILGTIDVSSGLDWSSTNRDFKIRIGSGDELTITLTEDCDSTEEITTYLNTLFATAEIDDEIKAYVEDNYVGLKLFKTDAISFTLNAGTVNPDAIATLFGSLATNIISSARAQLNTAFAGATYTGGKDGSMSISLNSGFQDIEIDLAGTYASASALVIFLNAEFLSENVDNNYEAYDPGDGKIIIQMFNDPDGTSNYEFYFNIGFGPDAISDDIELLEFITFPNILFDTATYFDHFPGAISYIDYENGDASITLDPYHSDEDFYITCDFLDYKVFDPSADTTILNADYYSTLFDGLEKTAVYNDKSQEYLISEAYAPRFGVCYDFAKSFSLEDVTTYNETFEVANPIVFTDIFQSYRKLDDESTPWFYDQGDEYRNLCYACDGTGIVNGITCTTCNGVGNMISSTSLDTLIAVPTPLSLSDDNLAGHLTALENLEEVYWDEYIFFNDEFNALDKNEFTNNVALYRKNNPGISNDDLYILLLVDYPFLEEAAFEILITE